MFFKNEVVRPIFLLLTKVILDIDRCACSSTDVFSSFLAAPPVIFMSRTSEILLLRFALSNNSENEFKNFEKSRY